MQSGENAVITYVSVLSQPTWGQRSEYKVHHIVLKHVGLVVTMVTCGLSGFPVRVVSIFILCNVTKMRIINTLIFGTSIRNKFHAMTKLPTKVRIGLGPKALGTFFRVKIQSLGGIGTKGH